jgi:hypothetical protein
MIADDVGHKNIDTTRGYIQSIDAIEDAVTGRIFAPLMRNAVTTSYDRARFRRPLHFMSKRCSATSKAL